MQRHLHRESFCPFVCTRLEMKKTTIYLSTYVFPVPLVPFAIAYSPTKAPFTPRSVLIHTRDHVRSHVEFGQISNN